MINHSCISRYPPLSDQPKSNITCVYMCGIQYASYIYIYPIDILLLVCRHKCPTLANSLSLTIQSRLLLLNKSNLLYIYRQIIHPPTIVSQLWIDMSPRLVYPIPDIPVQSSDDDPNEIHLHILAKSLSYDYFNGWLALRFSRSNQRHQMNLPLIDGCITYDISFIIVLIWLMVYLPLWKIWKSNGMMIFPIYGK